MIVHFSKDYDNDFYFLIFDFCVFYFEEIYYLKYLNHY